MEAMFLRQGLTMGALDGSLGMSWWHGAGGWSAAPRLCQLGYVSEETSYRSCSLVLPTRFRNKIFTGYRASSSGWWLMEDLGSWVQEKSLAVDCSHGDGGATPHLEGVVKVPVPTLHPLLIG